MSSSIIIIIIIIIKIIMLWTIWATACRNSNNVNLIV